MAEKVKCKTCLNSSSWACPHIITPRNYAFAKECLEAIKNTICCNAEWEELPAEHELYCEMYRCDKCGTREKQRLKAIYDLESKIKAYEAVYNQALEDFIHEVHSLRIYDNDLTFADLEEARNQLKK